MEKDLLRHWLGWTMRDDVDKVITITDFKPDETDRMYKLRKNIIVDDGIEVVTLGEETMELTKEEAQVVELIYVKFFKMSFYEKLLRRIEHNIDLVVYNDVSSLENFIDNDKYMFIASRVTLFKLSHFSNLTPKNALVDDNIPDSYVFILNIEESQIDIQVPIANVELKYNFLNEDTNELYDFRLDTKIADSKLVKLVKDYESPSDEMYKNEIGKHIYNLRSQWYRGLR